MDLSGLNETQKIAVTHSSGPMMILPALALEKQELLFQKYLILSTRKS